MIRHYNANVIFRRREIVYLTYYVILLIHFLPFSPSMTTPEPNEKQLLADIDALRGQFPQTQDLYREVCVLLFFRGHAGIKPKMTHKPKSNKEQRPYYSVNSLDVVN